jgi:hypothetical protein
VGVMLCIRNWETATFILLIFQDFKRPLYVVGAGDLGTTANALDTHLGKTLKLARRWNALVLIDEADVFLEERSLHELERNAMVAVFLRHMEYAC